MPWGDLDPEDPNEIVGVECAAAAGTMEEMARCLVEEYLKMGMGPEEMLGLFENPFFGLTHGITLAKGKPFVVDLIRRAAEGWSGRAIPATEQ